MQKGTLMKRVSHSSVMLLLFFLAISQVYAAPVTLPPGLNPGDPYRLAFVTSLPTDAIHSDIQIYNIHVITTAMAVYELSVLNTDWFAIASTGDPVPTFAPNGDPFSNVDARDNTGTNPTDPSDPDVPIYNLAGDLIAAGNQDLWDGHLIMPILYTELGTPSSAEWAWTGTRENGMRDMPLGEYFATVGNPHLVDMMWIQGIHIPTQESHALYGISGPLTAPVPLPSAILLFGSGLVGLIGFRRKFKK